MRSRARLTYEQVQAAKDGQPDERTGPLLEPVIKPLFAAYDRLLAARHARGTIELELPERKITFGADGRPSGVERRQRLASHMLIEEFMIAANVAAASELAEAREPCLYRVHDKPDPTRLEALAQFLEQLGVPWSRTAKQPGDFTRLLQALAEHDMREMASSFVLRSQAQAIYNPRNIGHFGLNLKRYAHFTSPIRRYSDLVVHRALIRRLGLGPDGLGADVGDAHLASLGEHLSRTERKAMEAERRAFERLMALFLADRVGTVFAARVTTVVYFGLFVTLDETGADGLVPVSTLGDEPFQLDERHQALVGSAHGRDVRAGRPGQGRAGRGRPGAGHAAVPPRRARARQGCRTGAGRVEEGRAAPGHGPRPPTLARAPPPLLTAMRLLPPEWRDLAPVMLTSTLVGMTISLALPLLSLALERAGVDSFTIGLNTAANGLRRVPRGALRAASRGRLGVAGCFRRGAGDRRRPACWCSRSGSIPGSGSACGWCSAWRPRMMFILSETAVNALAPEAIRGRVLGVYATLFSLGFVAGPLVLTRGRQRGLDALSAGRARCSCRAWCRCGCWRRSNAGCSRRAAAAIVSSTPGGWRRWPWAACSSTRCWRPRSSRCCRSTRSTGR